jgi:hypothetical protein
MLSLAVLSLEIRGARWKVLGLSAVPQQFVIGCSRYMWGELWLVCSVFFRFYENLNVEKI